ncbi:peptidylprolyl isomerase [Candidatus Pacearchaeota archaeon CG06_land_8_20_14_3_00_35_12]|nr:MAG: peptidylprolyl isomerase [Candidatus Pacearchaeota archaeon CG06_land_8_20_14_3_00_35_12]
MQIKKNDFIELEFTAKVKETGEVFDSTSLTKGGKTETKPLKICIGEEMVLPAFEKDFEGKEVGKDYSLELSPENAFGKRDNSLVKTIPLVVFSQQGIKPVAGTFYNIDGLLVRVISVSSGRVMADFNNPLSGKNIIYLYKINKMIENEDDKIKVLAEFFLGAKSEDYKIMLKDGKKILVFDKQNKHLGEKLKLLDKNVKLLIEKAKKLLNADLIVEF